MQKPSKVIQILYLPLGAGSLTFIAMAFITTNAESRGAIFWHLLLIHDLPAAWLMLCTLAAAFWLGSCRWGKAQIEEWPLQIDRYRYRIAVALWVALCAGTIFVYHNHPLSMDEYGAVFQAKVFASGEMHGQFPPGLIDAVVPRAFQDHFLMVNQVTGAVSSAYWPGFSLLLAPFIALGIPWACNPLLVALSFLLIGRITREIAASGHAAGWAMLFGLASPAFVVNGITYYAMPAHLLFNLGFACLLLSPTPRRLFFAGLTGGYALILHNPFPHLAFALPWIFWLMLRRERRITDLTWLALGYLPVVILLGAGWSVWQREMLSAGITDANIATIAGVSPPLADRILALGREFLRVFEWPSEAIVYARLGGLIKLWLWASPLLLLLAWWGGRQAKHPATRLLCASGLLTFFAYFTIRFDQGHGWGYRYFHSAWGVLPALAALGMIKLRTQYQTGQALLRQIAWLAVISLVTANGLRFFQIDDFIREHLASFPPRTNKSEQTLVMHNGRGYYAKDLIQNDPWLRGNETVFFVPTPAAKARVLEQYPGSHKSHSNRFGETYTKH